MTSRGELEAKINKAKHSQNRASIWARRIARPHPLCLKDMYTNHPHSQGQRVSKKPVTVPSVKFLKDNS
jgi:hypothetical protein